MIYHTSFQYRNGVHTEFQGVAIFFVISGFIMTHISRNDPTGFFTNRCVRIIPLYFLMTIALFLFKLKALLPFEILRYLANNEPIYAGLTLEALAKSLFFIPYKNPVGDWQPIVAVGWTLNLEMYFYILYAVALLISIRFAPVIVSAIVLSVNLLGNGCADDVCAFYAHPYTHYFVLGIAAYYLWQVGIPLLKNNKNAFHSAGMSVLTIFFLWHLFPEVVGLFSELFITAMSYLLPFLIVVTALFLHSAQVQCNWRPFLVMGEASYALYLVHTLVIGQLRAMGNLIDAHSGLGMLLIVVTISSLIAIVLHYGIERPVTRYLRSVLLSRAFVRGAP